MTAEQRAANSNGIWLCNVCSRLIDGDAEGHPIELLQEWRSGAEADAKTRMVVRPLSETDVVQRMQSTLAALPNAQSLHAVNNVHQATQAYLSSLDKRIDVESSYLHGAHQLELRAETPVDLQMTFKVAPGAIARDALVKLFTNGEDASFDVEELAIEGSPLFEHLLPAGGAGRIEISAIPTPTILRLLLRDSSGRERVIEEVSCSAVFGTQSAKTEAECFGGLMAFKVRSTIEEGRGLRHRVDVRFDTKSWDQKDIRLLPEFERVGELTQQLFAGDRLCLEVVAERRSALGADVTSLKEIDAAKYFGALIAYTGYARRAARFLNVRVPFIHGHEFDGAEVGVLERCARACERTLMAPYEGDMETIVSTEELPPEFLDPNPLPLTIRMSGAESDSVRIFNQIVELPRLLIDVPARVVSVENIDGGARARVIARPLPEAPATYFFAVPT